MTLPPLDYASGFPGFAGDLCEPCLIRVVRHWRRATKPRAKPEDVELLAAVVNGA